MSTESILKDKAILVVDDEPDILDSIAEQLDMPLGTVTKQLSRAYAMLRQSLQQQEQAEIQEV